MITFSILFILMYANTMIRLRIKCGNWGKDFSPMEHGLYHWMVFLLGTVGLIVATLYTIGYLISHNILP